MKRIKVIYLEDEIVYEQNIDFGGRELLSKDFNNFLDKRYEKK